MKKPLYVTEKALKTFIKNAFEEDIQDGDHSTLSTIPKDLQQKAKLLVKEDCILAGVELAEIIFKQFDKNLVVERLLKDGDSAKVGDIAFYVTGSARSILSTERLVLNCMQRMSGIATLSSQYASLVADLPVKILDTRKTTALNRYLEKWAVRIGGCFNYRDGLYDWFMIKDNHIKACGGIQSAIQAVHSYQQSQGLQNTGITVEVKNLQECEELVQIGGVSRIMFDNFELPILREAVAHVNGQYETEASGGVTLHTVRKIAETGVDFVSVGALTHSAGCLDLSLKVIKD